MTANPTGSGFGRHPIDDPTVPRYTLPVPMSPFGFKLWLLPLVSLMGRGGEAQAR
jgi:hypothetical protein